LFDDNIVLTRLDGSLTYITPRRRSWMIHRSSSPRTCRGRRIYAVRHSSMVGLGRVRWWCKVVYRGRPCVGGRACRGPRCHRGRGLSAWCVCQHYEKHDQFTRH